MSTLGEIRDAIRSALGDVPAVIQVSLVGADYDDGQEKFSVRALVGEPTPDNERLLDELLEPEGTVPMIFAADPTLDGIVQLAVVRKHSGHRAFKQPDDSVLLGTEFLVEIHR